MWEEYPPERSDMHCTWWEAALQCGGVREESLKGGMCKSHGWDQRCSVEGASGKSLGPGSQHLEGKGKQAAAVAAVEATAPGNGSSKKRSNELSGLTDIYSRGGTDEPTM